MKYSNKFGSKIKELRGDVSLRNFAELIGVSHTYLASLENGVDKRSGKPLNVTADAIIRMANGLNIDPHLLFELSLEDKLSNNYKHDEQEIQFKEEIPTNRNDWSVNETSIGMLGIESTNAVEKLNNKLVKLNDKELKVIEGIIDQFIDGKN